MTTMQLDTALDWLRVHHVAAHCDADGRVLISDMGSAKSVPPGLTTALAAYPGDLSALVPPDGAITPPMPRAIEWPALLEADAFSGLAGDFVRVVSPHTEADPAALLLQFLAAVGCIIGRGPHVPVEADRHGANLFLCLVGDSAKGRKGTSWGHVRAVCERVVPNWATGRVVDGIGSGQALIECVRDARRDPRTDDVADPGATDKRLLWQAPEFAGLLAAQRMEGSTLSAVLRNAWDSGRLQVQTRTNPLMATGAHIGVIAHITRAELLRVFTETDAMNGVANRFLWAAVRRSKALPFGGDLAPDAMNGVVTGLHNALRFARTVEALRWREDAADHWRAVYPALSEARPGLLGAVTARAEAQVLRLALVYALLDCSAVLALEHLHAALAIWQYCDASAAWVFGDRVGDATADTIFAALRGAGAGGMTRTEISALFGRHLNAGRLAAALGTLADARLARCESEVTTGRPVER